MMEISFAPFPNLTTDRLILRELQIEDEHEIFALRSDDRFREFLVKPKAKTIEDARKFIHIICNIATNILPNC